MIAASANDPKQTIPTTPETRWWCELISRVGNQPHGSNGHQHRHCKAQVERRLSTHDFLTCRAPFFAGHLFENARAAKLFREATVSKPRPLEIGGGSA